MRNFKCGVVSVSFRQHSPREIIQAASNAGLDCIEWGSDVHAPCNNDDAISEIVALQKEFGISCSSYGTYFYLGRDDVAELHDYAAAAKRLGTDTLRLWCGTKGSAEYSEDEKQEFFDLCKRAAQIAQEENVRLCMECHAHSYTDEPDAALELMHSVNSPHFLMYWQANQNESLEYNLGYAKLIAPYTVNLHVFNITGTVKNPLAEAKDTWLQYIDIFGGDRALLLEFMPDNKIESLEAEAKALIDIAN
ncbi:MAG: TIM barrel protein [Clostridia bacterium]|nr:TIM barrel protein [Clostridia bacterium]